MHQSLRRIARQEPDLFENCGQPGKNVDNERQRPRRRPAVSPLHVRLDSGVAGTGGRSRSFRTGATDAAAAVMPLSQRSSTANGDI